MKSKLAFSMFLGLVAGWTADAEVVGTPCAVVIKAGKGVQLIPEKGKVQSALPVDSPLACGAMLTTHLEPVWIKLSNQTTVKVGPESFLELPASGAKVYRIYRGSVLLSAPASLIGQTWTTPNAELDFSGGVSFVQYSPAEKVSIAGCFNRKVEFRNKFNSAASQVLSAGEMSRLAIHEARVIPSHPSVMHHSSVLGVLSQLGVEKEEQEQMVAVVKQVYEDRSKSFVSEVEGWSEGDEGASRSIASIPQSSKSTIDPKEAAFSMKLLRERLYGSEQEQARFIPKPVSRAPASAEKGKSKHIEFKDFEKRESEERKHSETKRIEKEIERLNPDSAD